MALMASAPTRQPATSARISLFGYPANLSAEKPRLLDRLRPEAAAGIRARSRRR